VFKFITPQILSQIQDGHYNLLEKYSNKNNDKIQEIAHLINSKVNQHNIYNKILHYGSICGNPENKFFNFNQHNLLLVKYSWVNYDRDVGIYVSSSNNVGDYYCGSINGTSNMKLDGIKDYKTLFISFYNEIYKSLVTDDVFREIGAELDQLILEGIISNV